MIGNIDSKDDLDATRRVHRAGLFVNRGDSETFMLGYQLGFMAGYHAGRDDDRNGCFDSYAAYQRDKERLTQ